jgi:hypothetical protein
MIDQDLVAEIAALGTAAGERVYLGNAPQRTDYPLVVVRRTGGSQPKVLGSRTLFSRSEFSFNVFGEVYSDAMPIANTITDYLKNYRGTMGDTAIETSRCTLFPTDQSEIEGDKVTRWVAMAFLFMHA